MSLSIGAIVLKVADLERAAAFWTETLGYAAQPGNPAFLAPRDGGRGPRLHLDTDDRTHLDLWAHRAGADVETEVRRLISLGAKRVEWDYPPGADFVVLADTEGNLFCVIT